MSFKDNLKNWRKKSHLSQESLAFSMLVSRQTISKWENGDMYPSTKHILMLTQILGCRIEDLIDTDLPNGPQPKNQGGADKITPNKTAISYSKQRTKLKQERCFYWVTGAFAVAIMLLLGVGILNAKTENQINDYQTAIFDKIIDGSFADVLTIAGYTNKRVLGYGITENDRTFYIKCELEKSGEGNPCAAIIYFCKNDGQYSCEYQYLDDLDYLPKGEYHQVG